MINTLIQTCTCDVSIIQVMFVRYGALTQEKNIQGLYLNHNKQLVEKVETYSSELKGLY